LKNNSKQNISQLFNFTENSYFERSSRPIYAIVFLLPFIVFYELAVFFIKTDVLNESPVLVDAFVWLQKLLGYLGLADKIIWLAPPAAVVLILFGLQVACRKQWKFHPADFLPMSIECILLAIPLIVFSLLLNSPAANPLFAGTSYAGQTQNSSFLVDVVAGIGAGIYEELVFRLILISVLMLLFQDVLRFERKLSVIVSVSISAALFSAHHHIDFITGQINPSDPLDFTKFIFRTLAGIYFAVLFAIRGFGVTAGTHSFYNILAVFINTAFFGG